MTAIEAIDTYRKEDDVDSLLVVLGDSEHARNLRAVAIAWQKHGAPFPGRKFKTLPPFDELWRGMTIDY